MQEKNLTEIFSNKARLQLSFWSYMKVTFFSALGISFISTLLINSLASIGERASGHIQTTPIYGLILLNVSLLIFGWVGSAIAYPLYSLWCNKIKGQSISGKLAATIEIHEE